MNAADLLSDLAGLGIRLEARDDRLRFFPRQAMTPDLLVRLKAHKAELLLILAEAGERCDTDDATSIPPPALEGMGADGWPEGSVDPDELPACSACGSIEVWKSMASDPFGMTTGRWRCLACDPPRFDPRGNHPPGDETMDDESLVALVDTREQDPLDLQPLATETATLAGTFNKEG